LNTKDHLAKFAEKSDDGLSVGYSSQAKDYMVYTISSKIIEESSNVTFNEHTYNVKGDGLDWLFDIDLFSSCFKRSCEVVSETGI
jgi:phage baseplate assembly protein gpV